MPDRYIEPDWFTRTIFNPFVAWLTQRGVSVYGSRVLAVRGRSSGEWRTNPVNLLDYNESNLTPIEKAPGGVGETIQQGAGKSRLELWWWLVACAALPLLLIEWWVYTRRVHL